MLERKQRLKNGGFILCHFVVKSVFSFSFIEIIHDNNTIHNIISFQIYALLPMSIVNQVIMISDMPLSVSMSHCERHRQAEHLIHKQ